MNTFRIGTGGCIGDGKVYKNDAAVDVNIPSAAGGGNTRIDRVVVRFTWASFQGVITRIAGVDASSPTPPAATKTSGTTYDILLYQVNVDTSGNLTIELDEREWALIDVDDSTIENNAGQLQVKDLGIVSGKLGASAVIAGKIATGGVSAIAQLANDIVDDTKAGNRVPALIRRKGGHATNWDVGGPTSYTPTTVRMQAGSDSGTGTIASGATGNSTTNFSVAFGAVPLVIATAYSTDGGYLNVAIESVSTTQVIFEVGNFSGGLLPFPDIHWLAIGPE